MIRMVAAVICSPTARMRRQAGQRHCPRYLARAIDNALKAEGAVIAAASASPPPPDAEKVHRSLEDALADGVMSPALPDEWDAAVTRYGTGHGTPAAHESPDVRNVRSDSMMSRLAAFFVSADVDDHLLHDKPARA
jgi:hypothetical protein